MSYDHDYAKVVWRVEDVQNLRPNWTRQQCAEWLDANEKCISGRLVELGWEVMEQLLPIRSSL